MCKCDAFTCGFAFWGVWGGFAPQTRATARVGKPAFAGAQGVTGAPKGAVRGTP